MKDYLLWHEEKYGRDAPESGSIDEFLADEAKEREEWRVSQLTQKTVAVLSVHSPSIGLIQALKDQRLSLHEIKWSDFEDIVAELLKRDGYTVTQGKRSKDGGVDIFAEKDVSRIGKILTVWQAKRLKPTKKVGISVIRELADTRREHSASKGFIVTNAFLTRGAIKRVVRDKYTLGKVDGEQLLKWIRDEEIA